MANADTHDDDELARDHEAGLGTSPTPSKVSSPAIPDTHALWGSDHEDHSGRDHTPASLDLDCFNLFDSDIDPRKGTDLDDPLRTISGSSLRDSTEFPRPTPSSMILGLDCDWNLDEDEGILCPSPLNHPHRLLHSHDDPHPELHTPILLDLQPTTPLRASYIDSTGPDPFLSDFLDMDTRYTDTLGIPHPDPLIDNLLEIDSDDPPEFGMDQDFVLSDSDVDMDTGMDHGLTTELGNMTTTTTHGITEWDGMNTGMLPEPDLELGLDSNAPPSPFLDNPDDPDDMNLYASDDELAFDDSNAPRLLGSDSLDLLGFFLGISLDQLPQCRGPQAQIQTQSQTQSHDDQSRSPSDLDRLTLDARENDDEILNDDIFDSDTRYSSFSDANITANADKDKDGDDDRHAKRLPQDGLAATCTSTSTRNEPGLDSWEPGSEQEQEPEASYNYRSLLDNHHTTHITRAHEHEQDSVDNDDFDLVTEDGDDVDDVDDDHKEFSEQPSIERGIEEEYAVKTSYNSDASNKASPNSNTNSERPTSSLFHHSTDYTDYSEGHPEHDDLILEDF
ncbi:hypothetical protein BDP27DRAFT_434428 [Rhodocollybia butyracea]|uniref:Uncharacterized protein n=1 Tax=Rhodocollybia butyracea TaxID=206335 RepID=A0A9P5PTQ5_9AGAR|nr:hypothetical protein BDP27DRAFT_434428 [Rhodocollybia butyracea]